MCPICHAATERLLVRVPTSAIGQSNQLTVRGRTPVMHRCLDGGSDDGRPVMTISGELDAYATALIGEACHVWLSIGHHAIVDLSGITLIDAAGTRFIEQLRNTAPGGMRLRDPSRIARRVFDILQVPLDDDTDGVGGGPTN